MSVCIGICISAVGESGESLSDLGYPSTLLLLLMLSSIFCVG